MMAKEVAWIQEYILHLTNGDNIVVSEDYYDAENPTFPEKVAAANDNDLFCIGDRITGFSWIPKKSIVYISTGQVRKFEDGDPVFSDIDFDKRVEG